MSKVQGPTSNVVTVPDSVIALRNFTFAHRVHIRRGTMDIGHWTF